MIIPASQAANPIRYVALGDSYTIGTGALPEEAWPTVLTERLRRKGIPIELTANLARNGWTTQDMMDYELPALKELHADFVTVLIGTNDWVHGVEDVVFQQQIHRIFQQLTQILPDPKAVMVITIPDFSAMPVGSQYSGGRDISKGIAQYNSIIAQESKSVGFKVVDLYPLSQTMRGDASWSAEDGLHPSAKGYARWADLIEANW